LKKGRRKKTEGLRGAHQKAKLFERTPKKRRFLKEVQGSSKKFFQKNVVFLISYAYQKTVGLRGTKIEDFCQHQKALLFDLKETLRLSKNRKFFKKLRFLKRSAPKNKRFFEQKANTFFTL
jgi:hypothetical protein